MIRAAFLCITFLLVPSLSFAQVPTPTRLKAIESAWLQWAKDHKADMTQLAVSYRGQIVLKRSLVVGADHPMTLASLSKSITGMCILALEKQGILNRNDTLEKLQSEYKTTHFPDGPAQNTTIEQLLTHTSSMKTDLTQGWLGDWLNKTAAFTREITNASLNKDNQDTNSTEKFSYNNGNYAALGTVIEAVTATPYEKACKKQLQDIDAIRNLVLGKKLAAYSSFGGWVGSAAAYLEFANAAFGNGTLFQTAPLSLPHKELGKNLYYGPGVYVRKNRTSGFNIWHFGLLCLPNPKNDGGSYFAVYGKDWSVAVTHNVCLKDKGLFALDAAMVSGVFGDL